MGRQVLVLTALVAFIAVVSGDTLTAAVKLQASVEYPAQAKPFCGLVPHQETYESVLANENVALEFFYVTPADVCVSQKSGVNCRWSFQYVEEKLAALEARGHQAVIRLADVQQMYSTEWELQIPSWLIEKGLVQTTTRTVWSKTVTYGRWDDSDGNYFKFWKKFLRKVAKKYNDDKRVAYVQGFFGHWAEGHVYRDDIANHHSDIGVIFPSPSQYSTLLGLAEKSFTTVKWGVGISLADSFYWYDSSADAMDTTSQTTAMKLMGGGSFEDTFLDLNPATNKWNGVLLEKLNMDGSERWTHAPRGGEVSYSWYNGESSQKAATEDNSRFIKAVKDAHMTYILASDDIITKVAPAVTSSFGYDFHVSLSQKGGGTVVVTIENKGCAPIYYDTYVTVGGKTPAENFNLRNLSEGGSHSLTIENVPNGLEEDVALICARSLTNLIPFTKA